MLIIQLKENVSDSDVGWGLGAGAGDGKTNNLKIIYYILHMLRV